VKTIDEERAEFHANVDAYFSPRVAEEIDLREKLLLLKIWMESKQFVEETYPRKPKESQ
jgi:hypothetical protein